MGKSRTGTKEQFEEVDSQIRWAVHEGELVMESLRTGNQDTGARTGPGTSWDVKGSPQSSQARHVWWKINGKTKAAGNGRGNGREGEEMDEGGGRNGSVCHL